MILRTAISCRNEIWSTLWKLHSRHRSLHAARARCTVPDDFIYLATHSGYAQIAVNNNPVPLGVDSHLTIAKAAYTGTIPAKAA